MRKHLFIMVAIFPAMVSCSSNEQSHKKEGTLYGDFLLDRYEDGFRVSDYRGNEKRVVIPDYVKAEDGEDVPIVTLSSYCFAFREGIEEIILGKNIRAIEDYAFKSSSVKKIIANIELKNIGKDAFASSNVAIKEKDGMLYLPTAESDYGYLFGGKPRTLLTKAVYTVTVGDGCQVVGDYVFEGFVGKISLPNSIRIIGDGAFRYANLAYECSWDSLETIGSQAFYETQALKYRTNAFANYSPIGYGFDFGVSLKEIGKDAFKFKPYEMVFVGAKDNKQGILNFNALKGTYGDASDFSSGYTINYLES